MIEVKKGLEPDGLRMLRIETQEEGLSPKDAFEQLRNPLKTDVLKSLIRDQGQLCVYCMSRIPREDKAPGIAAMTIEHFIPLEPLDGRDVGQALDYQNLFVVCHGNTTPRQKGVRRNRGKEALTCDKHRGNTEFRKINPLRSDTLNSISYNLSGEIDATDSDVRHDLLDTLNLNCSSSPIIGERKAVLDTLIADMASVPETELLQYCGRRLEAFQNETNSKTPYVGILIWYLRSMVDSISKQMLM